MVGSLGKAVFEVYDDKIVTFNTLSQSKKQRVAIFDILNGSQKMQFLGNDLSEIQLSVNLNRRFCNIEKQLKNFESMLDGQAYRLIIGGKNLGKFAIEELQEVYKYLDGKGNLIGVDLSLRLREYK